MSKARDLLEIGEGLLTPVERFHIRVARRSLQPGVFDRTMRMLQRHVGANWIDASVKNLRHVHGLERVPNFGPNDSVICVANHRSFFDLYLISSYLVKRGMTQRLMFPVRSQFFYDKRLGFVVNGAVSFFAMYPPVFRERERATLNLATLDETARLLKQGGAFVGLHPEGQRNKGDDPYALLPAQSGVGRVIHDAKVMVLPVFVNGLVNDFTKQISTNLTRKGTPIIAVFGKPIDFGGMLEQPSSPRVYKRISERTLEEIAKLGEEERNYRRDLS
jgi:1-acyl-sn-glycerol-3-phosphate acyltransferase